MMLKQQSQIYAAATSNGSVHSHRSSSNSADSRQVSSSLEHVSAAELEQWEISHTELGCIYVECIFNQLKRFRNAQTAELDLTKVEASQIV